MKTIVFFVFDLSPRIDRRILEFISKGYRVNVYGYCNDFNIKYCSLDKYKFNKIAEMRAGMPYKERASHIKKINRIIDSYNREETIFYFFTINVVIATLFSGKCSYIYEESDMLFDRFCNKLLQKIVIAINKRIISKSMLTVFTSEGFADYYYGKNVPSNIEFITNRVSEECLKLSVCEKRNIDFDKIRFSFVGNIRYQTILNVSEVVSKQTTHTFDYYGNAESLSPAQLKQIKDSPRVTMHGRFSNPKDLPSIYSDTDFVVCTYDVQGVNPRYAEPNKIYEAIFFRTPIIVSSKSFLADKVERLGIGFSIDPNNEVDIETKIKGITPANYQSMVEKLNKIPQYEAVNINDRFFERIDKLSNS